MRPSIVIAMIMAAGGLTLSAGAMAASVSRSFAVTAEVPCTFTVPKAFSAAQTLACNGAQARNGANPTVRWTRDQQSGQYFVTIRF
jgi:hypothetical protein